MIALFVVGGFFACLERKVPLRVGQKLLRAGWKTDVVHFLVSGLASELITVIPVGLVIAVTNPIVSAAWADRVAAQPRALQFLEALIVVEFTGYWAHCAMHQVPWLWRIHSVHHSSQQMDWLAAARVHPLDQQLGRTLAFAALRLLGFSPGLIGGAAVVVILWAIFLHANVRLRFPRLRHLVATPEFHHWHHAHDLEARDKNFAGLFPWVDRLFGTHHLPSDRWLQQYGVEQPMPDNYLRQLAQPFRADGVPSAPCPDSPS